jgi:type I restriction enzyme S subunit
MEMTADGRPPAADELPSGWAWAMLGEVCEVNPRMSWPESFVDETPVSFVPMAAVDDVTGAIVAAEPRPISEVWRGYKRFAEGDVIFARITPCMENGKAAIATGLVNGIGLGSTEFHVLRPKEPVSATWVYHYVRQQAFRNEAAREMTGTAGQLRVPKSFVEEALIPLPPLGEQRRIVAKIEALFAQSRRGREALEAVPGLLARFRQAVLAAAFRGELTGRDPNAEPASVLLERTRAERHRKWEESLRAQGKDPSRRKYKEPALPDMSDLPQLPEGWVWATAGMLAADEPYSFTDGPFGSNLKTADYVSAGVRVIRLQNLGVTKFRDQDKAFVSEEKFEALRKHEARAGDVVIAALADPVGRACLVPEGLGSALVKADCIRLRVHPELALGKYVMFALNTPDHFKRAEALAHGVGRLRANLNNIKSFVVPLAPLGEQRCIVARIEALFAQADILEAQVEACRRRLEQVDQAVLARAFRSELVPQDPNDEPTSVLLERV